LNGILTLWIFNLNISEAVTVIKIESPTFGFAVDSKVIPFLIAQELAPVLSKKLWIMFDAEKDIETQGGIFHISRESI